MPERVTLLRTPDGGIQPQAAVDSRGAVGNGQGETLLAWTEGTSFAKGGSVAWQVFDKENKPSAEKGRAEGVPASSLATAFAKQDGAFVIVY